MEGYSLLSTYKHESFTDFTIEKNRKEFQEALDLVKTELGKDYDLLVGGQQMKKLFQSIQLIKKKSLGGCQRQI